MRRFVNHAAAARFLLAVVEGVWHWDALVLFDPPVVPPEGNPLRRPLMTEGEALRDGDRWVVAGSYISHSQRTFWDRLDTVIRLDLPMPLLLWRVLRRTWRRWRLRELLWGTNYERFWPQFLIWRKHDSLVAWIVTQHAGKRREMLRYVSDARWSHIRFVRLTSAREVEAFVAGAERIRDIARGATTPRVDADSAGTPG